MFPPLASEILKGREYRAQLWSSPDLRMFCFYFGEAKNRAFQMELSSASLGQNALTDLSGISLLLI